MYCRVSVANRNASPFHETILIFVWTPKSFHRLWCHDHESSESKMVMCVFDYAHTTPYYCFTDTIGQALMGTGLLCYSFLFHNARSRSFVLCRMDAFGSDLPCPKLVIGQYHIECNIHEHHNMSSHNVSGCMHLIRWGQQNAIIVIHLDTAAITRKNPCCNTTRNAKTSKSGNLCIVQLWQIPICSLRDVIVMKKIICGIS